MPQSVAGGELDLGLAVLFFFCSGVFAVRYGKTFGCSLVLTMLILAGCSESPELAAAKKIATKVAQARELMKDQTTGSYKQAEGLLREALATEGANRIGKHRANELFATLLSEINARQLSEPDVVVEGFGEADLGLSRSLSEFSRKAGAMAYAAGLEDSSDETLQKYREKLSGQIPAAEQAKNEATEVRTTLEKKLGVAKRAAFAAAASADAVLLQAAQASGDEQLIKTKEGAAKRLEADRLSIALSDRELLLLRAKEDEIRRESVLVGLREGLASVDKLIKTHKDMLRDTIRATQQAKTEAKDSAKKLIEQVEAFNDSGTKLAAKYDQLIARQSKVVHHFTQALRGAEDRRKNFRKFKTAQPPQAEPDERVEMLVKLDAEVALAVSVSRAQISLASLREQKIAVLKRVQSRFEQTKKLTAGVGLVPNSPRVDAAAVKTSVDQSYQAALADLNSAQNILWTTALGRLKSGSSPDEVVKKLERAEWNWQVLGMLGLVHESRGGLTARMGKAEQARADVRAAATYLTQSKKAQAGVLR